MVSKADCSHKWQIITNTKTWVLCFACGSRFPVTAKYDGTAWIGEIPEEYKR